MGSGGHVRPRSSRCPAKGRLHVSSVRNGIGPAVRLVGYGPSCLRPIWPAARAFSSPQVSQAVLVAQRRSYDADPDKRHHLICRQDARVRNVAIERGPGRFVPAGTSSPCPAPASAGCRGSAGHPGRPAEPLDVQMDQGPGDPALVAVHGRTAGGSRRHPSPAGRGRPTPEASAAPPRSGANYGGPLIAAFQPPAHPGPPHRGQSC